jgi:hypothetical protein
MNEWGIPYTGNLPVTDDWIKEHQGDYYAFRIRLSLHDIIDACGIDSFMDIADEQVGVPLEDCQWEAVGHSDDGTIIIRYVGMIPEEN